MSICVCVCVLARGRMQIMWILLRVPYRFPGNFSTQNQQDETRWRELKFSIVFYYVFCFCFAAPIDIGIPLSQAKMLAQQLEIERTIIDGGRAAKKQQQCHQGRTKEAIPASIPRHSITHFMFKWPHRLHNWHWTGQRLCTHTVGTPKQG